MHIALLDTTIIGQPGSMRRYREQLESSLAEHAGERIRCTTINLGCTHQQLERVPARLRMWRHHLHIWWSARKLQTDQFDAFHLLDGSFGYVVDAIRATNVVATVHDIIPRLQMEGRFPTAPPVGRGARWLIQKAVAGIGNAKLIVSDSQSTKDDLEDFGVAPRKGISVVPLAIEPGLFGGNRAASADEEPAYVFHLGNNGFYKNRVGVVEVFKRIEHPNVKLIMAGPAPDESITKLVQDFGLAGRIEFQVYPDQSKLASLYRGASVFLFPSIYEGFGWPPLEAMSVGCPVVSSDAGSLPEVVGEAGVVVNTNDYAQMAQECGRVLSDTMYRSHLVTEGYKQVKRFGTQRLAESMVQEYEKLGVGS